MTDTSKPAVAAVIGPMWVCAAMSRNSPDGFTYLNGPALSMLHEAIALISALEAERDGLQQAYTSAFERAQYVEGLVQHAEIAAERSAARAEAAEKRVREECARLGEEGYDRPVGTPYRSDGVRSKHDQCPHGRYQYEDCERCYAAAIRKGGEHV